MTTCPHCHTANRPEAAACQACGQTLSAVATAQDPALPTWLQQLKPEAEGAATAATTNGLPAEPELPLSGTSTIQSVTAAAPQQHRRGSPTPKPVVGGAAPTKGTEPGAQPVSQAETTSLISEDDLPVWLRAFGEPDTVPADNADVDQSWMVGNDTGGAKVDGAGDLAQSWQAPARPAAKQHSGAGSVFTKVSVGSPVATTRPERTVTLPPSSTTADEAVDPTAPAPPAGAGRAATTQGPAGRRGRPTAAMAIAAVVALILIVLVVFAILAS